MTSIKKLTLILLSTFILCFLFWNRFIRDRKPLNISVNLAEITYLIYLCFLIVFIILLLVTIKEYFYKSKSKGFLVIQYYQRLLNILDQNIKSFLADKYTSVMYNIVLPYYPETIKKFFILYFITCILPKLFVAIVFFFDVFYFHKINYFYSVLPVLALISIFRYLTYSLTQLFLIQCSYMQERIVIHLMSSDTTIVSNTLIASELLVQEYTRQLVLRRLGLLTTPFDAIINISIPFIQDLFKQKGLTFTTASFNHKKALLHYHTIMKNLIINDVIVFLSAYNQKKYDLWVNLFSYSCYVLGWAYILYVGTHPDLFQSYTFLITFVDYQEPFSLTPI